MKKVNLRQIENVKRSDAYRVDPKTVTINKETNPRLDYGDEDFKELKEAIRRDGVLQPISVTMRDGKIHLTHGFRRMSAVLELIEEGTMIESVPVIQVEDNLETILEQHLTLNSGKPLTDLEKGETLSQLMKLSGEENYTKLAQRVGMDHQKVRKLISFVRTASTQLKESVIAKDFTLSTAEKIVKASKNVIEQNEIVAESKKNKKEGRKITAKAIGGKVAEIDILKNPLERVKSILMDVIISEDEDFDKEFAKRMLNILNVSKTTKHTNEDIQSLFKKEEYA